MTATMDYHIDKECSALGGLFQTIVNDMKTQAPIWDEFINKATKLHSTLRTTIVAIGTFLEAFQRVADMATNTRGATREIGSALTRLCMRHRSIEQKLKVFTSSILDLCVNPLQERMEEWKKTVLQLDKDHAKEYKRARNEIKKASSDTIRLQKKVRKGKNDMQNKLDSALQEVNDKFLLLEETEKNAVRTALIEERNRFCLFISCLKPVVDEEIAMLTEITHLQEVLDALCMQAGDPYSLPPASEQVIIDLKTSENHAWSFQVSKTPPSSPSSLGSRKSSMCSISSMNSSSSGSTKSHSPSHHLRHRASSQTVEAQSSQAHVSKNFRIWPPIPGNLRLSSVSSQDSGFTSQDTLFHKNQPPPSKAELEQKKSVQDSGSAEDLDSNSSTPSPSHYSGPPQTSASTWSNWPDPPNQPARPDAASLTLPFDRPHTISTAYERHARPALTAQTFEPPESNSQGPPGAVCERPFSATAPSTPSPYAVPVILDKSTSSGGVGQHQSRQDQSQKVKIYASVSVTSTTASPYAAPCIVPPPKLDMMAGGGVGDPSLSSCTHHKPPAPPPGPKPRVIKAVTPPVVPDFNSAQTDQIYMSAGFPQPVYVNMNELAHMAVAKQKESEEIRRSSMQPRDDGTMLPSADMLNKANASSTHGQEVSPYARPSIGRCQRSISVPVQNQEGRELADAIKELEASTAALNMVYEGGGGGGSNGQPGSRHSVAGYSSMIPGPAESLCETEEVEIDLPPYPSHQYYSHSHHSFAAGLHSDYGAPVYAVPTNVVSARPPLVTRSQSFRLPPSTHRHMPNSGIPSGQGSVTLRRGSLPNKPPTPVRRTSSISSGMASIPASAVVPGPPSTTNASNITHHGSSRDGERSGSNTPTPQGTPTRHRRTTSELIRPANDRPPDISMRHSFAAPTLGHSDDEDEEDGCWPPPPPADFMVPLESESTCSSASTSCSRASRGSVSDTHAGVIHSLNAVFSHPVPSSPPATQAWHPDSLPLRSNTSGNQTHTRSLSQSSDDITPTAENPSPDNFLCQIKRGVSLRRAQSNDRSAPRIPAHPR